MGYEKELAELRKEWKESTDKYEQAIEDGYDVDADMWTHDVMEIERQIYVYEQAAKVDEYEVKAKAFDRIVEERNRIGKLMHNKEYPQVFTDEAFWNIDGIIIDTESGESDAKK